MHFPSKEEVIFNRRNSSEPGSFKHTIRSFYKTPEDYPGLETALADPQVAIHIVKTNGLFLKDLPDNFKDNKEVVSLALENNPLALRYASDSLKSDKELVLSAVSAKPQALQYVSSELKADKEVVFTAVRQDYKTLQYASEDLQNSVKEDGLNVLTKKSVLERMQSVLNKFTPSNANSHKYGR